MKDRKQAIFWGLSFAEGIAVAAVIGFNHHSPFYFQDFTPTLRMVSLIILGLSLLLALTFMGYAISSYSGKGLLIGGRFLESTKNRRILLFGFFILALECLQGFTYVFSTSTKQHIIFVYYDAYLKLLLPIMIWGFVFSIQAVIVLGLEKKIWNFDADSKRFLRKTLLLSMILIAVWIVLGWTEFGYIPNTYRYETRKEVGRFLPVTNPLMGFQVTFTWLLAVGISFLLDIKKIDKIRLLRFLKHPFVISLIIWTTAFIVWQSVPLEENYLLDFPEVPSGEIFPNSDAFYYAKEANRFLVGEGFEDTTTHVMYALLVAVFQIIAGSDYQKLILMQYAVAAFGPVLIFWLAARLHSRYSGLMAAGLWIFREWNGLLMGSELAGPTVSTLLTENVAVLGMLAFLSLILLWVENPQSKKPYSLLAGTLMGISLLIRADFAAALIVVTGVILILYRKKLFQVIRGLVMMWVVVLLIISPWMIRNWQKTGVLTLDKGNFIQRRVTSYIEQTLFGEANPVWVENDRNQRMDYFSGKARAFINHFGNNFQQMVLYLPNQYQAAFGMGNVLFETLYRGKGWNFGELAEAKLNIHTRANPYYWVEWDGKSSLRSIPAVPLMLFCIAAGMIFLSRERLPSALIMLSAVTAHLLVWSFAGFSGNRFIKAVDWLSLVCLSIGIIELGVRFFPNLISANKLDVNKPEFTALSTGLADQRTLPWIWLGAVLLIIVGWSPSVLEAIVPQQYTESDLSKIVNQELSGESRTRLSACLENGSASIFGKALYPRYYQPDEILGNDRRKISQNRSFQRINFYLVGTENIGVSLEKAGPEFIFPHQTTVMVTGEMINENYFQARCLLIDPQPENFSGVICGQKSCQKIE